MASESLIVWTKLGLKNNVVRLYNKGTFQVIVDGGKMPSPFTKFCQDKLSKVNLLPKDFDRVGGAQDYFDEIYDESKHGEGLWFFYTILLQEVLWNRLTWMWSCRRKQSDTTQDLRLLPPGDTTVIKVIIK